MTGIDPAVLTSPEVAEGLARARGERDLARWREEGVAYDCSGWESFTPEARARRIAEARADLIAVAAALAAQGSGGDETGETACCVASAGRHPTDCPCECHRPASSGSATTDPRRSVDAKRAADELWGAMENPPEPPAVFATSRAGWRNGWAFALGRAREIVAELATAQEGRG